MSITPAQKTAADQAQLAAAQDNAAQVRLVAGPGTGKSKVIEMRVADVLNGGTDPRHVCVISFTRAARGELAIRIAAHCATQPCAAAATRIDVRTMHSLALRILKQANLLAAFYPSDPVVIDDWEYKHIYDAELCLAVGCPPGRAAEIRLAHDASWQTLNPQTIDQAAITQHERQRFNVFHTSRSNLYSLVLPGEVIYQCVQAINSGTVQTNQLPELEHLIVDEFQDLNACDQEFVHLLSGVGTILFVAGDDDQSIYSFRHADPSGIVQFNQRYPQSSTHILSDCFRCTPAVLAPATTMISFNPARVPKTLSSLFAASAPPVQGTLKVWSFATAADEARAIALSCKELITAGMSGREDEIIVLVSDRSLQLPAIMQELGNLGIAYDPPGGQALRDDEVIRGAYCVLRILANLAGGPDDYMAHRALLTLMDGIGAATARTVGDLCVTNNQNFHGLFYLAVRPQWLSGRADTAVARATALVNGLNGWSLADTIAARTAEVEQLLFAHLFTNLNNQPQRAAIWNTLAGALPQGMTLGEMLDFLSANTESEQDAVVALAAQRLGTTSTTGTASSPKKIRIMTMHGANGLTGKVVFIPSAEQGILPSFRAIHATGLLNEHRRLFYVSVTRAMAACIISHSAQHVGAVAFRLGQQSTVNLPRSQFLNEMNVASVNRTTGLTPAEAATIMTDITNL